VSDLNYDPRPPEWRKLSGTQSWPHWVALGGAAIAALGSFLPWATVSTGLGHVTRDGIDGDGQFTLATSLIFTVLYFGRDRFRAALAAVAAFATGGIAIGNIIVIIDAVNDARDLGYRFRTAQVEIGLWLVVIGAGAMLVGIFGRMARLGK
jgi:hypothetical protein